MIFYYTIIIIIIIIIILIYYNYTIYSNIYLNNKMNRELFSQKNNHTICNSKLTDLEYLDHMIPHHQVAVDISEMLLKKTKSPIMHDILRKLIWTQKYEILLMKEIKDKLPYVSDTKIKMAPEYITTVSDIIIPNTIELSKTYCDPHFFDPKKHKEHLKHMKLTEKSYIEHMIPHHQVAVDMSKILLRNTNNDFMIYLAYRIIKSQNEEIIILHQLLDYEHYESVIL